MSDKIQRAQEVERLLNHPLLIEGFDNCKQAIFQSIERTPLRDDEGLKHLRICLKLLNDVRLNLVSILNSGKVEEFRIEQEKRLAPTLRDFKVR